MKTNGYSKIEIDILNQNPNVVMVKYGRQIEYKILFKKWAVQQSLLHPEMSAIQIFELAGFDRNILGSRTAESRIRYWKCGLCKKEEINKSVNSNIKCESLEKQKDTIIFDLMSRVEYLIAVLGRKK